MPRSIYLDNQATTRVDPRVLEAMLPYFTEHFGNAASRFHRFGEMAHDAVEKARAQVAYAIGASPREIVFTSGATESNNLALKGAARLYRQQGNHIITAATEHKAVLDVARRLEREGFELTVLPVDGFGLVDPDQIAKSITDRTLLVSVMAANNEVGTLQPIADIGALCKARRVLFHCDAAQAFGKIPLDVEAMGIDLLSASGHKIYGPKGVGALYVRRRDPRVRLEPLLEGGGHEGGLRAGTLPVPLVVGLGVATELCLGEMVEETSRLASLREQLREGIQSQLAVTMLNGHPTRRLAGNLNLSFAHVHGEALLVGLRHIALSSGSACTSANPEPSYVLRALGVPDELAQGSIRFGLGRFNTTEDVEETVRAVVAMVTKLRGLNPMAAFAGDGAQSTSSQ